MKTVYPELFQRMQQAAVSQLASSPKGVPYQSKMMLSMILGQPMHGTMAPFSIQRNRAVFARQPGPPQSAPSRADKLTLSSRMLTPSQAAAQRGKP